MHHFFVEESRIGQDTVIITGEDVNHIRNVLRLKPGEEISVSPIGESLEEAPEYRLGIREILEDAVVCDIRFIMTSGAELSARVILFQALPKGDKLEWIIQKCVELGVSEIVPVSCENCVVKLDRERAGKKVNRWQGISEAAAKQSRRSTIPKIHEVLTFREALEYANSVGARHLFMPYERAEGMEEARELLEAIKPGSSDAIAIFIGPEGGFSRGEVEMAEGRGWKHFTLGRRILRTETAAMTIMAWLMYRLEE